MHRITGFRFLSRSILYFSWCCEDFWFWVLSIRGFPFSHVRLLLSCQHPRSLIRIERICTVSNDYFIGPSFDHDLRNSVSKLDACISLYCYVCWGGWPQRKEVWRRQNLVTASLLFRVCLFFQPTNPRENSWQSISIVFAILQVKSGLGSKLGGKMQIVVALCHFCELNGPSVVFTTQVSMHTIQCITIFKVII